MPIKQYPCIESTIEFFYGDKLIRIWIDEQVILGEYPEHSNLKEKIESFLLENEKAGPSELAAHIKSISPRVSALQLKDSGGMMERGIVIYFTDFSNENKA